MLNKVKEARKYLVYALVSNILFGTVYYFTFSWLSAYSLLYAYLGSLALIWIGLKLDEYMKKAITSEKVIADIKQLGEVDREKNQRLMRWLMDSFVSFKTILFVFYLFVLIVSQIVMIDPSLVSKELNDFLTANSYGIVLLTAVDMIITQFSMDRREMKENAEVFERMMREDEE